VAQPVKFSAPIYLSEAAARTSGDEVRKDHWLDCGQSGEENIGKEECFP